MVDSIAALKRTAKSVVLKVFRISAFAASDSDCLMDEPATSVLMASASDLADPGVQ